MWPTPANDIATQAEVAQHFPSLAAPWVYKKLTRWYIFRVLLHKRDEHGSIKRELKDTPIPPQATTYGEEALVLENLAQMFGEEMPGLKQARVDLAKKYGREVR